MHLSHGEVMLARDKEVCHTQQPINRVQVGNGLVHSIVEGRNHCNTDPPFRLAQRRKDRLQDCPFTHIFLPAL